MLLKKITSERQERLIYHQRQKQAAIVTDKLRVAGRIVFS